MFLLLAVKAVRAVIIAVRVKTVSARGAITAVTARMKKRMSLTALTIHQLEMNKNVSLPHY